MQITEEIVITKFFFTEFDIYQPKPMNYFAENLRFVRKLFDVSQTELALQVNKRQTTVGGWENKVSQPDIDNLIAISEFFGISIDDLVKWDIEKRNLITEKHIKKMKEERNLMGNAMGNLIRKKTTKYQPYDGNTSMVAEGQQAADWVLLRKMEELRQDFGLLRDSVEKAINK
jgi:transcriptional regulator with XRE-family HTH domain